MKALLHKCLVPKFNIKIESIFNKLSETIHFIGVSIQFDSLQIIPVGIQTPILLPCNLELYISVHSN